jgi:hypothetical protein
MINRAPLYTQKKIINETIFFTGFLSNKLLFFYIKNKKIGDIRWVTSWRGSVAGVSGVPTAPRVVEAPLGAAMLAAARAASGAATGAAADESGNEAFSGIIFA